MENDKYISLADSYINRDGSDKALTQFLDAIPDVKVKFVLSTKNPKSPSVKLTKKNLKKLCEIIGIRSFIYHA